MVEGADGLTQEIAAFIAGTAYPDFPPESLGLAKQCLIDGTGVILSGSTENVSLILRNYLESIGGKPESAVLGSKLRVAAPAAALANGTSGHAQDFDDTQLSPSPDRIYGLLLHPTSPVLAATLALGEAIGISGGEFLTAFSLGFEVECKIAEAIDPIHYMKGYHSTGTIGAFGAAAAASKILRLPEQKIRYALGIVASMSAGIRANFGTMTKALHAGRAAENGVVAARLAQLGFTSDPHILENPLGYFKILGSAVTPSDPHILENPLWGYSETSGDGFDLGKICGKLGNPYSIVDPGVSIKPYPSVVLSHPSMNAMLDLVKEHDLKPEEVAEIQVDAGSNVVNIRYPYPQSGLEGKFSLRFCLTSILLRRRAGIREFSDEFVTSPEAQEMMKRIKVVHDPEMETKGYAQIRSRLEVRLKDGRILKKNSGPYKGGPENPFTEAEIEEKFIACAGLALREKDVYRALDLVKGIEKLPDMGSLLSALLAD